MSSIRSMKIADIIARSREDPEPPCPVEQLTLEQRATLKAYGRAGSVRWLDEQVTLKIIADYAQEDWGYGTVTRARVPKVMKELEELGWTFDMEEDATKTAKKRGGKPPRDRVDRASDDSSKTAGDEQRSPSREPRPEAKTTSARAEPKRGKLVRGPVTTSVPRLQRSSDGADVLELVGDIDPATLQSVVVSVPAATKQGSTTADQRGRTKSARAGAATKDGGPRRRRQDG